MGNMRRTSTVKGDLNWSKIDKILIERKSVSETLFYCLSMVIYWSAKLFFQFRAATAESEAFAVAGRNAKDIILSQDFLQAKNFLARRRLCGWLRMDAVNSNSKVHTNLAICYLFLLSSTLSLSTWSSDALSGILTNHHQQWPVNAGQCRRFTCCQRKQNTFLQILLSLWIARSQMIHNFGD